MLLAFDHVQCTECMPASNIQFTLPSLNSTCHQLMIYIFRSSCDEKKATAWHGVACELHGNLEVWSFHLSQSASSRGLGLEVFWKRVFSRKTTIQLMENPLEFGELDDFH